MYHEKKKFLHDPLMSKSLPSLLNRPPYNRKFLRVRVVDQAVDDIRRELAIKTKIFRQDLHICILPGNHRGDFMRSARRSIDALRRLSMKVFARMHGCETLVRAGREDFVDVELAASGLPARAGAVLLLVDDLGVEDPEGRHVGVEVRVDAGALLARDGHRVFGEEGFVGAGEAV